MAAPLHPGRPRELTVSGDGPLEDLSGTYDLVTHEIDRPVWRRRGETIAEIAHDDARGWVLKSVLKHEPHFDRMEPQGRWEAGLLVAAVFERPSTIAALAFPCPRMDYNFYLTGGAGRVDLMNGITFPSLLSRPDLVFLQTSQGEQLPAIHHYLSGATYTILYSHGNAEDLGLLVEDQYIEELSFSTGASVLAYDYVGYSLSRLEGRAPSEEGCYRAVEAAWTYLTELAMIPAASIVLYGRSIGSGPAVELASRSCASSCAGVVLESPIASGASAVAGSLSIFVRPLDIFLNYTKMGSISIPITIMHGKGDTVVPISNGECLLEKCQESSRRPPLWVDGHGHNDMPRERCLAHVSAFLRTLESPARNDEEHANGRGQPSGNSNSSASTSPDCRVM